MLDDTVWNSYRNTSNNRGEEMMFTDLHKCGCQVIVSTDTKQTIIYYCEKHGAKDGHK